MPQDLSKKKKSVCLVFFSISNDVDSPFIAIPKLPLFVSEALQNLPIGHPSFRGEGRNLRYSQVKYSQHSCVPTCVYSRTHAQSTRARILNIENFLIPN